VLTKAATTQMIAKFMSEMMKIIYTFATKRWKSLDKFSQPTTNFQKHDFWN
jgi:hypothetical protein